MPLHTWFKNGGAVCIPSLLSVVLAADVYAPNGVYADKQYKATKPLKYHLTYQSALGSERPNAAASGRSCTYDDNSWVSYNSTIAGRRSVCRKPALVASSDMYVHGQML